MEKLKLSFKLLSQIPKKVSLESSPLYKDLVGSLTNAKNPKHLFNNNSSSFTQPSHHSGGLSEIFSGPFANPNPVFLKQVVANAQAHFKNQSKGFLAHPFLWKQVVANANAHLKNQGKGVLDHVFFMRRQFPRLHFQIHRFNISPLSNWRSWIPIEDNVILGLIGANVAVLMLWRVVDPAFMKKHFMISVENVRSGRVHTMITSAFSHMGVDHLFSNMLGLYFFGTSIGRCFGSEFLLKLYLAGALGGSIFYLVHHAFMSPISKGSGMWYVDPKKIPGLGASGAVNAIMLLDIFLRPTATIYFNLFIPVPAALMGAILIGTDLWRMTEKNSQISGAAHLGGAFVAALAWARITGRI